MSEHVKAHKDWIAIDAFFRERGKAEHKQLGMVLKEYVEESQHSGWDGFSSADLTGVRRFLMDFVIYYRSRGS